MSTNFEYDHHGNFNHNLPRFVAISVSALAVYLVTLAAGAGVGIISAALTVLCISPLFTIFNDLGAEVVSESVASHIFAESQIDELQMFREEEHSLFGRLFHHTLELCNMDEVVYIACILREHQGLLVLLIGGIASMMMALIAGLEDVSMLKAFFLSVSCYGLTTIIVARSARNIVHSNISLGMEVKLSGTELKKIMESIPQENFVPEKEMENCDPALLVEMLFNRSEASTNITDSLKGVSKQNLAEHLRNKRNFNDSCCICLNDFERGEIIRVLPSCHHEFHKCCIDKWAQTFATRRYDADLYRKRGRPTCPLCNAVLKKRF
ncbi:hypothetical protein ACHAWX_000549 [Stephanocyclus meneghinianus]